MKISKKLLLPFLFLFLGAICCNAHPFHVSICQIDFNKQSQSLEISVKIFADDLIEGLATEGHKNLYIGEEQENAFADKYICDYLKKSIQIKVNDKDAEPAFVGKEMDKDVLWSYMEIENIAGLSMVEINCSLLTDVFSDQNNIIQVNNEGEVKNLLLSKRNTNGRLSFD